MATARGGSTLNVGAFGGLSSSFVSARDCAITGTMHRREFLKAATAAAFYASLGQKLTFAAVTGGMQYRTLGHTGEKVSLLGIGGYHIGRPYVTEAIAIQIVRTALDSGVNFLDNSWSYNNGLSESAWARPLRMATGPRLSS